MISWALVNLVLSTAALLFCLCNPSTPHRLRFFICLLAMTAWLVPWQLLEGLWVIPVEVMPTVVLEILPVTERLSRSVNVTALMPVVEYTGWWTVSVLALLMLAGLISGIGNYRNHVRYMLQLGREAQDGSFLQQRFPHLFSAALPQLNLRIQRSTPGAFTSGIHKPVIWLHESLLTERGLESVLQHELMHVRRYDNFYLLLVTVLDSLFWWNPLVRLLGSRARTLLELSCDEACASEHSDYLPQLQALVLRLSKNEFGLHYPAFVSGIPGSGSFNIARLKILQRSHTMKLRHYINVALLGATAAATLGSVAAQSATEADEARYRQLLEQRAAGENVELDERDVRIGLEHYASNLEAAFVALQGQNEEMEQKLAVLERQLEAMQAQRAAREEQLEVLQRPALEQQSEALQRQRAAIETQRLVLQQQSESLQRRNEVLQRENDLLQRRLQELQ